MIMSIPVDSEAVGGRVERLERRGRAAWWLIVALLVGQGASAVFLSERTNRVVRTRRIEVLDSEGRLRGVIGMEHNADDCPHMRLIDETGKPQFSLYTSGGETEMRLYRRGESKVNLSTMSTPPGPQGPSPRTGDVIPDEMARSWGRNGGVSGPR
jgi:hypothetical protein